MQAGDTVKLKSGGPLMTVNQVADDFGVLTAWCDWFEGTKAMKGHFPVTSLKVVNDDA